MFNISEMGITRENTITDISPERIIFIFFMIVSSQTDSLQEGTDTEMILIIHDYLKEARVSLFKASNYFSNSESASDIAAFVCVVHNSNEVRGCEYEGIISQFQSFVKTILRQSTTFSNRDL